MPGSAFKLLADFLSLFIINPHDIVLSSSGEVLSFWMVIHCQNIVFLLCRGPNLFSCFCCKLIQVSVCATDQNYWTHRRILILGSPSETIDRNILFGFRVDINLADLIVSTQIEHSQNPITVTTCCHRIFITETCNHHFCLLRNDWLYQKFVF